MEITKPIEYLNDALLPLSERRKKLAFIKVCLQVYQSITKQWEFRTLFSQCHYCVLYSLGRFDNLNIYLQGFNKSKGFCYKSKTSCSNRRSLLAKYR